MSKQYRYPGVTPFTRAQSHLFFGRDDDLAQLYKMLQRKNLVVLHGKSGLGKSSLINAGLLPRLAEAGKYQPIIVRLGAHSTENQVSPLLKTKEGLASKHPLLERLLPEEESLWAHAKSEHLTSGHSPLLIFDQFEEIFSYPEAEIEAFQRDLAELLYKNMPLRYRRRLERIDHLTEAEEDLLEESLQARILLAVRSDRLHLVDRLKDYFPNILRHSYELHALSPTAARAAITEPAALKGDYHSAAYRYTEPALDHLLNYLQDEETGRVEGILVQMLCEHYEKKVVIPQGLQQLDLPHIGEPNTVVRNYYQEKIAGLPNRQQTAARLLIEDGLVSEGEQGMRLSLHENSILSQYQIDKKLLAHLVDQRLLRSEPFLRGGYTYELSHDRMLPAVIQARQERKIEENRQRKAAEAAELRALAEAERQEKERVRRQQQLRQVRLLLAVALMALLSAAFLGYKSYQQSLALSKANQEILDKQAISEQRLRDFEAADSLRKKLEIQNLLSRATTYENLNQPGLALRSLRDALIIDSTRQEIRLRLDELVRKHN